MARRGNDHGIAEADLFHPSAEGGTRRVQRFPPVTVLARLSVAGGIMPR